jgi:hypothetical protein
MHRTGNVPASVHCSTHSQAFAWHIPRANVANRGAHRAARNASLKDKRHAASRGAQSETGHARVPHENLFAVGGTAEVAHATGGEVDTGQLV